jgi:ribosomal protein S18 acetylase RimI-like enzyme
VVAAHEQWRATRDSIIFSAARRFSQPLARVLNQIEYKIRPLRPDDEPILWTMLHHGLNTGEPGNTPPTELVRRPEFARYVEGWGGPHDAGFVAYAAHEQEVLGAVWFRSPIPGPGEPQPSDEEAPELAYAVAPGYRRRGIGAALFTQWVRAHPEQSVISLASTAAIPSCDCTSASVFASRVRRRNRSRCGAIADAPRPPAD